METSDKYGQMRKGLLELAILRIISKKDVYVADMLSMLASTDFKTQEGTLYPLLSRLRREGLVDYVWIESESGPPRKYYKLTGKGTSELKALESYAKKIITVIADLGT